MNTKIDFKKISEFLKNCLSFVTDECMRVKLFIAVVRNAVPVGAKAPTKDLCEPAIRCEK